MARTKQTARKNKRKRLDEDSSSRRQPAFDTTRFETCDNFAWYELCKDNDMIVEKTIHPDIDESFTIKSSFAVLGWEPILNIEGEYYPELVWQFYANIHSKANDTLQEIHTFVKGVSISLTSTILAHLIGVPDTGTWFHHTRNSICSEPGFLSSEAEVRLAYVRQEFSSHLVILSDSIPVVDQLLVYLLGANVIPRKGSSNELRNTDIYFLDKMLHGLQGIEGIPLGSVILRHMRSIAKHQKGKHNAPYPVLISKILASFKVDFSGERCMLTTPANTLDIDSMGYMNFMLLDGVWHKNLESKYYLRHPRDPPVPPIMNMGHTHHPRDPSSAPPVETTHGETSAAHLDLSQPQPRARRGLQRTLSSMFTCFESLSQQIGELRKEITELKAILHHHHGTQAPIRERPPLPPIDRSSLELMDDSD